MRKITIILFFALVSISVFGQNKIGYIQIDSVRIILPDYRISEAKVKESEDILNDSLNLLVDKLTEFYKRNFSNVDYSWNSTLEKQFNDTLMKVQTDIENYTVYALGKISDLKESELKKVDTKINYFILEFCKINNITCVVEKKSVLYCIECVDYTKELIDFILNK